MGQEFSERLKLQGNNTGNNISVDVRKTDGNWYQLEFAWDDPFWWWSKKGWSRI